MREFLIRFVVGRGVRLLVGMIVIFRDAGNFLYVCRFGKKKRSRENIC